MGNQSEKCLSSMDLALQSGYLERKYNYRSSQMDVFRLSLCMSKFLIQYAPNAKTWLHPMNNQSEKCPFSVDLTLKNYYFERKCICKSTTMDVLRLSLCPSKILVQYALFGKVWLSPVMNEIKKKSKNFSFCYFFHRFI